MAGCLCPENYTNIADECVKITTINNIQCPPGCALVVKPNGNAVCECLDIIVPTQEDKLTSIELTNPIYFKDVSFTVAYSPILEKWISYYSFAPNYYLNHQNYFQTGINNSNISFERGLWSHLLCNL